ncbi:MAG: competence/damage-inducible protein A [Anaerolineae bacterium]
MPTCEIIAIGNELLQGDVLDSNTHWLIQQVTGLGGRVTRAVMVRDEPAAIVAELCGARERGADLILLGGGLGPTDDDLTLGAVALATGCPLRLDAHALEMVRQTYQDLADRGLFHDAAITPAREKMAWLPQGATPLDNPAGAAPGVLLPWGQSTIICLPGVPGEMRAIWEGALPPVLSALFGISAYLERALIVDCGDESLLAPVLSAVSARHPEVYIKSRARRLGLDMTFAITLSKSGDSRRAVEEALRDAVADLTASLSEAGIAVLR